METIVEEPEPSTDSSRPLSSKAAEVVHQVEQAALTTVSASDKLDLVTKLTDYVSDALAEGSLTDNDLQRIFQVTTRLGEQLPDSLHESSGVESLSIAVSNQQAADLHWRTTSELLDWADDVAAIEAPLGSDTVNMHSLTSWSNEQSSIALLDGLEKIAERFLSSPLTSEQAAAKALLNAARHSRVKAQHSAVNSKYLNGVSASSMLVVPVQTDTSTEWAIGNHENFSARKNSSHPGNGSGRHQHAQAKVTPSAPVFQRLYQLSETWRAHKAQLKEVQEGKDARAASPTPPVRLSSQARQRAADRLYAHAVQKRARQQAARQAQEQDTSNSRSPSPRSHAFKRHAPDFFQRQQDLLARRQFLAEQRRPWDEESLQHCTGRPAISAFAHSLRRSTNDLLTWQANKDEKMRHMRNQQAEQADAELTLIPRINRNSRQMALSLASRAAEQAPHMLAVIQSQPQGWVLADRPATARRPATGAASPKKQISPSAPAWVRNTASTSMRLVQTGREPASHSHASSNLDAQTSAAESVHDASLHQAPWLGYGGVRNMDAGHVEAAHKGQKPTHAAYPRQAPTVHIPTPANTSGKHAHPLDALPTTAGHSSLSSHRLDATFAADTHPHPKSSQPSQQASFTDRVHAVDPIEAFAPAFVMDRVSHTAESGSRVGPSADAKPEGLDASLAGSVSRASGIAEITPHSHHAALQESNVQALAQSEWTGFAEDDSIAEDADLTFDTTANREQAASLLGDHINVVQRPEGQDSSAAAPTAADWADSAQVVKQQAGSEPSAKVQHLQPSDRSAEDESSTAPVSVDDKLSEEALSDSADQNRAIAGAAAHASKDRQSAVSKNPAQQSGIVSARRALQAMALKAAAEAAYKVSLSTDSSGSQQRQVAMRRTSSSARRSGASWTPQLPANQEQTGSMMSMHSVLKQKPKPLVPRTKLNAKAVQAALHQSPGSGAPCIPVNNGYASHESMRCRSSQEVSDQMISAIQKGSARPNKSMYADKIANGLQSSIKKPVKS